MSTREILEEYQIRLGLELNMRLDQIELDKNRLDQIQFKLDLDQIRLGLGEI